MAIVTITGTRVLTPTTPVRIYCDVVTPSGTKNNSMQPDVNGEEIVEVQTNSFENPIYTVSGIHFITSDSSSFQYSDFLSLLKWKYDGTNAPILNVTYGDSETLLGAGGSADIQVMLKSYSMPINAKTTKKGYMPIGSMILVETK